MKALIRTGLTVLMVIFLAAGLCYGQNAADQSYVKGIKYATQGKFKEAKKELERVLKLDRFYEDAELALKVIEHVIDQKIKIKTGIHYFRGLAYVLGGQVVEAIAEYDKAIEINPKQTEVYFHRGTAYLSNGQHDQAISDYTKVIEITPQYAAALNNRGIAYFIKGQHEQGISDLNKAIDIKPGYDRAYLNRGKVHDIKGKHDQAISDYTKAIEINPRYANAYNNRGLLYWRKLDDKKKACADWKRACELGDCRNYTLAKRKGDCK